MASREYICKEVPTENGGYLEIEKELILCKECKHMRTDRGNVFCETLEDMFYHYEYEQPINEDFFCAWAEPKETK